VGQVDIGNIGNFLFGYRVNFCRLLVVDKPIIMPPIKEIP
jgi:hypothetical protein